MLRLSALSLSPSRTSIKVLLVAVGLLFSFAIVLGLLEWDGAVEKLNGAILVALVIFLLILVGDAYLATKQPLVSVDRSCAKSVAVDRWTEVTLILHHHFHLPIVVEAFDGLSKVAEYEGLPLRILLQPGKSSSIKYRLKVSERGPFLLQQCALKVPSPLGLWSSHYRVSQDMEIKVYPDFSAIKAFTILATDNHESQIGIKRKPRRGEGMEFMQLRDFRSGDSLRQVDWKATSRRKKLISKEYQDERDQQIVLLIDSGRRMRAKDDSLSHFDHSLNAMLLLSYIALRQGDSVSVMSFGNAHRWVSPKKGLGAMKTILNEMYDLHAGNCASDYIAAAEKLSVLQRKRSLIILVTNSRDEEVDELLIATSVLRRRHVVLIANIREAVVDQLQENGVDSLNDALSYAGVHHYLNSRREVQQKISSQGVYNIDCLASQLPVRVANSYLEIKRAGVL